MVKFAFWAFSDAASMKAQFSHRAADDEEERRIKGLSPSKIDEEEHDRRVSVVDINPTIVSGEASKLGSSSRQSSVLEASVGGWPS